MAKAGLFAEHGDLLLFRSHLTVPNLRRRLSNNSEDLLRCSIDKNLDLGKQKSFLSKSAISVMHADRILSVTMANCTLPQFFVLFTKMYLRGCPPGVHRETFVCAPFEMKT